MFYPITLTFPAYRKEAIDSCHWIGHGDRESRHVSDRFRRDGRSDAVLEDQAHSRVVVKHYVLPLRITQ